ncbi:DUF411 domain-containing protein [Bordetella avium]|uniref:DUF411 domain-containing protein n=1 Tax=Bordetella avium TaxID=521 RepID=UPI000E6A58E8|nr:DUF411 domain-containing protein [Bordetella avium]RIQ19791.1 DUF411 domain-containing protein [Bordetella avium]RIQ34372.1 DUF411 domain-containing protein [Bordetella avium]
MTLRRRLLGAALLLPLTAPVAVRAASAPVIDIWKTPTCGCCGDWVDHLRGAGFRVQVHEVSDTDPVRKRAGIAPQYASCHTGLVGGYAIEGHVPAQDIQRLLSERPEAAGLAVPAMPVGSPGMDGPAYGGRRDPYDVLLVQTNGQSRVWRAIR